MSRFNILIFSLFIVHYSFAQEVFKKGNYYGLKYDGAECYAAVFDEIEIHDYFVSGRVGTVYFNLSRNKENINREYKKFNYKLSNRLLVIGETLDGKVDIMNETGEHYHLMDGPYSKVLVKKTQKFYGNDDLLIVRKNGKQGLYNWVEKTEVLPPAYSKIVLHESCDFGSYFIYAQRKGIDNSIFDASGNEVLNFKAHMVTDIYPSSICEGYILQWEHKVGYVKRMRNGSFFLLRPIYDDIYFPNGDASAIIVKNRDRMGLYYNFQKFLKCRYDEINMAQNAYYLAIVKRKGIEKMLKNNGELTSVRK